jgi:hypothetical protein
MEGGRLMNRLARIISEMSVDELKLIKRDLEEGNLRRLIDVRLQQLSTQKVCPVCGTELEKGEQKYVLEFGPADLRQKAYFDEHDCLTYFLENTVQGKNQ